MSPFRQAADSLGALADDLRRKMYLYIRRQGRPVGRDEAAGAVGISRKLAAFHLDKLVEKGLLEAHYARLTGRSGPGAGRPSKLYEPSEQEVSLSIPHRSYDFVGSILVDAVESRRPHESARDAARRVAWDTGLELGKRTRRETRRRPSSAARALAAATETLEECGYEPYVDAGGDVRLRNCPFHALARKSPELVCGLNQALLDGLLKGLGARGAEAVLDPRPHECCVRLTKTRKVA
ncbi:MAG: transcriptional regulator [Actinomycetota bacterium]|nr:transcriptional regulator [Actinomycetota bacterium]